MKDYREDPDNLFSPVEETLNASLDTTELERRQDWGEIQRARAEYIKEWEEDLRYALELANEGM